MSKATDTAEVPVKAPDVIIDPEARAAEKQRSRDEDQRALTTGAKTREDLRRENSHFRELAHDPIQWDQTRLV